jgi:Ca-activated chloride channel family protein
MPVQVRDPFSGQVVERTVDMEVQIDEELLKKVADLTGGEFFRAADPESLRMIFEQIDRLETSEIKLRAYRRYRELFEPLLQAAAGLLAAAGALWSGGLRVAPV